MASFAYSILALHRGSRLPDAAYHTIAQQSSPFLSTPFQLLRDHTPVISLSKQASKLENGWIVAEKQAPVEEKTNSSAQHLDSRSCWNASAKTRGEAFLEKALLKQRRQGDAASKGPEKTTSGRKTMGGKPVRSTVPCCYGCGAPLQTSESDAPGYVPLETFELKKKHRQLNTLICGRCHLLTQGQMIPAVGGHGGYGHGKRFVSAEQLREQLSYVRHQKALIIKLVDIVDLNGSFLTRIRDLVGSNPIILVATKVDLLPKETDLKAVGDWLVEYTTRKKLNVLSVHMTSSKSLMGISGVIHDVQQRRQGRNVYILGSTNVGKSAFVSALLQTMSQRDPLAAQAKRYKPVQSAMPGTTLGPIKIDAFSGGGSLFDTPGVHLHHRMPAVVPPEDLTLLAPHRRLRGHLVAPSIRQEHPWLISVPEGLGSGGSSLSEALDNWLLDDNLGIKSKSEVKEIDLPESVTASGKLSGLSIFWGGIARLDVVKAPPHLRLRFYGPSAIPIITIPTAEADSFYKEELGRTLIPPARERASSWPGLHGQHAIRLTVECRSRPANDVAISGLGWVTVESECIETNRKAESMKVSKMLDNELFMTVHLPRAVEVFVRSPIPIGAYGSAWYEYSELSEEEQERRPLVFA